MKSLYSMQLKSWYLIPFDRPRFHSLVCGLEGDYQVKHLSRGKEDTHDVLIRLG